MQQSEVSIWVPIVVGAIGFIGVIAGQFVNAWREDRRWKRDQEREELRWKRQNKADSIKYAHARTLAWREKRIELYSDYLQAIRNFENHYNAPWFRSTEDLDRHQKEENSVWQQVEQAARRVEFVASDDGLALLYEFRDKMRPLKLLAITHNPACDCIARNAEKSNKKVSEFRIYEQRFIKCMRVELGMGASQG